MNAAAHIFTAGPKNTPDCTPNHLGTTGPDPPFSHQVVDAQLLELQHDGAEVGPQDLGVGLEGGGGGRGMKMSEQNWGVY